MDGAAWGNHKNFHQLSGLFALSFERLLQKKKTEESFTAHQKRTGKNGTHCEQACNVPLPHFHRHLYLSKISKKKEKTSRRAKLAIRNRKSIKSKGFGCLHLIPAFRPCKLPLHHRKQWQQFIFIEILAKTSAQPDLSAWQKTYSNLSSVSFSNGSLTALLPASNTR